MDALSVVKHLCELATAPKNRSSIVKDQGCLPGLVLFLDNEDIQVIKLALKTLYLLAQHGPNRLHMRNEMGMIVSLKQLMNRKQDEQVKKMATQVYNSIMNVRLQQRSESGSTNRNSFLGNANKRAKIITLQIDGLFDKIHRQLCEEQLIQVKGVISFTFDMHKKRCVVRTKHDLGAEPLCKAVANTKIMRARQIVKNEEGNEVFLSFGISPLTENEEKDKINVPEADLPEYLPEDDDEPVSDKALARRKDNSNQNSGGWLSGVTNFISNTLYW